VENEDEDEDQDQDQDEDDEVDFRDEELKRPRDVDREVYICFKSVDEDGFD